MVVKSKLCHRETEREREGEGEREGGREGGRERERRMDPSEKTGAGGRMKELCCLRNH